MMAECAGTERESDYVSKPVEITWTQSGETVSTAVLEYALELADKADTEGVITSVAERFEDLKAQAQEILKRAESGDETLTQEMVDRTWEDLINVMQYLSFKQGEKEDLAKVIEMANTLDLSKYLEAGQDAFNVSLTAAKAVYADGDAMQEEVDNAWRALLKAMSDLRLKPSKDVLKALIVSAQTINLANVTGEDARMFRSALADAKSVYANEEATKAEVGMAIENLQAAIDKVIANAGKQTDKTDAADKTVNVQAEDSKTVTKASAEKSAKTGDAANAAVAAAVSLTAGVAVVAAFRKKKV